MVLRLDLKQTFMLLMDAGRGSNTRDELLDLWSLPFFARSRQISRLLVQGDCKAVLDWVIEINTIH